MDDRLSCRSTPIPGENRGKDCRQTPGYTYLKHLRQLAEPGFECPGDPKEHFLFLPSPSSDMSERTSARLENREETHRGLQRIILKIRRGSTSQEAS